MSTDPAETIRVGKVIVALNTAANWVRRYTNVHENRTGANPFAYPAYDRYDEENNDPRRLTDADLLAPALLNVRPSIRAFYELQRLRPLLEPGLGNEDLRLPLSSIESRDRIAAMVGPLYAVLEPRRVSGVGGTTLSKVLHRKAPESLVLHDRWVRACYVSDEGPVLRARKRSWADYMTELSLQIGKDIREQPTAFAHLDAATGEPGRLSHVRLLDIVAWTSQGNDNRTETER